MSRAVLRRVRRLRKDRRRRFVKAGSRYGFCSCASCVAKMVLRREAGAGNEPTP